MPKPSQFRRLVAEAKADTNILGFFLAGSRGKGFENKDSDYDPYMIVKDNVAKNYRKKYKNAKLENIHLSVLSFSDFRKYAIWGSPSAGDRYDFTHVKIFVDTHKNRKVFGAAERHKTFQVLAPPKTSFSCESYFLCENKIGRIAAEKGSIPKDKQKSFINSSLDSYVNSLFRSLKCFKNENMTGARMEAAKSIYPLLDAIFALELRPRPFDGYLEKELKKYPLRKFPWKPKRFTEKILLIQASADLKTQQEILKIIEKFFRKEGYGKVFDGWGKDLGWMKSACFS